MPKIAKELSPLEVSRLDKTGFNAVGVVPGLGLQIRGQSRSWILRVKIGDKVIDLLDSWESVGQFKLIIPKWFSWHDTYV